MRGTDWSSLKPRLARRLAPIVPGVAFTQSKADGHPLVEV